MRSGCAGACRRSGLQAGRITPHHPGLRAAPPATTQQRSPVVHKAAGGQQAQQAEGS